MINLPKPWSRAECWAAFYIGLISFEVEGNKKPFIKYFSNKIIYVAPFLMSYYDAFLPSKHKAKLNWHLLLPQGSTYPSPSSHLNCNLRTASHWKQVTRHALLQLSFTWFMHPWNTLWSVGFRLVELASIFCFCYCFTRTPCKSFHLSGIPSDSSRQICI